MTHRSALPVALAVLAAFILFTVGSAAAAQPSFPDLVFIVPGEFVQVPAWLDVLYQRLVNTATAAFPGCVQFRAFHRMSPLGSTAIIRIQCRAWERGRSEALPKT